MVWAIRFMSNMEHLRDDRIGGVILDIKSARAPHPRLRLYAADPIREAGNTPQVLDNMLLRDQPDWYNAPDGVGDGYAEDSLGHPASLGVMPQGPMTEVSQYDLR
jgi:hypothetical protein